MRKNVKGPSPAAKWLIGQLVKTLNEVKQNNNSSSRILNIGAGRKVLIEQHLTDMMCDYICDRIDVDDCTVNHPSVGKCWQCSVEAMSPLDSNKYNAVFANWVLEHVLDLRKASQEIYRVLKPSGRFIATIPNVKAPEFYLAKITPLWFHQMVRRHSHAYETHYAYSSIGELIEIFESAGFHILEVRYFSCVELYLNRISPLLSVLGKIYDKIISTSNIKRLMGNVCVVLERTL